MFVASERGKEGRKDGRKGRAEIAARMDAERAARKMVKAVGKSAEGGRRRTAS